MIKIHEKHYIYVTYSIRQTPVPYQRNMVKRGEKTFVFLRTLDFLITFVAIPKKSTTYSYGRK
ncbi:hypothetical protein CE91St12_07760 [Bacteroides uniformis]|uniref:Uncharacterized protein n=1 Tax=Bacteroides uniformis TaxID=820 RepID=A0AA37JUR4_BACUN|nr:hypothetical protein CE91St12_07760 [Bacteroides uniformis]GKH35905.1 hypothetical protein CE91St13_07760 [Bacteroides uniformis]